MYDRTIVLRVWDREGVYGLDDGGRGVVNVVSVQRQALLLTLFRVWDLQRSKL